ncbi:hemin uptake protein HemP [Diaphorobacter aerolatus]|uniref:Hemin uptake protein HemP n=1 Tax=Diaphorobacter aerolatus TaxID=1288495 RepID=A0A7H0GM49_9BURK|nr:hemin uptake protein HemP [Diaphorobacter aerolatus]QNP49365.1 hemin uptake protein HemP [Diaphorobacter aerolatus]
MSATLTASTGNALLGSANAAFGGQRASSRAANASQGAGHLAEGAAVDSRNLLQGQKVVTIAHNGVLYRLQATKLGKLILTK